MKAKFLLSIIITSGLLIPFTVAANGLYIFGGIGPTFSDNKGSDVQYETSVTYQMGVGKVFKDFASLIIEGFYVNYGLGTYEKSSLLGGGTYIDTWLTAFALRIGIQYDISKRFSINGKLGVNKWEGKTKRQLVPDAFSSGSIEKTITTDSGTDLSYSIGSEFIINIGSSIRVDYELFEISSRDYKLGLSTLVASYVKRFN